MRSTSRHKSMYFEPNVNTDLRGSGGQRRQKHKDGASIQYITRFVTLYSGQKCNSGKGHSNSFSPATGKVVGILFFLLIFPRQRIPAIPHFLRDVGRRACGCSPLVPGGVHEESCCLKKATDSGSAARKAAGGGGVLLLLLPHSFLSRLCRLVIDKSPLAPDSARLSSGSRTCRRRGSDAPPLIRARRPRRSIRNAAAALFPSRLNWRPRRTPELGCTMMGK